MNLLIQNDQYLKNGSILECLGIEIKAKNKNIIIVSMYRPPNTNEKKFLLDFNKIMGKIKSETHKCSLIGMDHNLDFLKSENHKGTSKFMDSIVDNKHLPCITRPTRITKDTATLIDNILISTNIHGSHRCGILEIDLSDHFPCVMILQGLLAKKRVPKMVITRKLDDKSINSIQHDIKSRNWHKVLEPLSTNEKFDTFHECLISSLDKNAPEKLLKIPSKRVISEPWMTNGLIKCARKQLKLYQSTLRTNSSDCHEKYKQYRNCLQRIKRKAKLDYFTTKCLEFRSNMKKLWSIINNAIRKSNDKSCVIDSIRNNSIVYTSPSDIAREMGQYFANVGESFALKIGNPVKSASEYASEIPLNKHSVYLTPCTISEIKTIIGGLPNKMSSGYDDITNILLKQLKDVLVEPLWIIFNDSLSTGEFPQKMKIADVVPLHKAGPKDRCTNFRPISLLLTLSKLLEKIVYKRIYNFLDSTDQIYKSQYGFRSKHSCEHAITELLGEIVKKLEQKKHTIAVFLDLSKAFDTLDHNILLIKMERYGIRGVANNWFKDYLTNRQLRSKCLVSTAELPVYSENMNINYGAPQGSCLGPLIFLIFCNDLYRHLELCNSILFADDTTIYKSHENLDFLAWCIKQDLEILLDWFKANKLTLNLGKSVCMLFNKRKSSATKIKITVDGITLPQVSETKFLGVWIDSNLNWKMHVEKIISKLRKGIGLLNRGKHVLTSGAKKILYFAQVHSHLAYCYSIWGNMIPSTTLKKLQKLQNKCLVTISKSNATPQTYKEYRILPMKELLKLENAKIGYKLVNNMLPSRLQELCYTNAEGKKLNRTHRYNTRRINEPNTPMASNSRYRSSILYQGPQTFSTLKAETKSKTTLLSFTQALKRDLFDSL